MSASAPSTALGGSRSWVRAALALGIVVVAAYLRFADLGVPSLWFDEILHVERAAAARQEPWSDWLTGLAVDRENGSLYYATQLLGMGLVDGEAGVRLIPALLGVGAVVVLLVAALAATGSWRVALTAAALLAVSPLGVYYSREGRPYAAVVLMASLLLLLALARRSGWTTTATYCVCIVTAYWGVVTAPLLAAAIALGAADWLGWKRSPHSVLAPGVGLLLGLLLFPTLERLGPRRTEDRAHSRLEVTHPLSSAGLDRLAASLTVSGVDRGSANARSGAFFALAICGLVQLVRKRPRSSLWVAGMALVPIAGWLALLVILHRWYNVRYTSVGLPAFLLLVAIGLVSVIEGVVGRLGVDPGRSRWTVGLLNAALLVLLLAPLWTTARSESLQKPNWRGVADLVGALAAPGEPLIARGRWSERCLGFYLERLGHEVPVLTAGYDLDIATDLAQQYPSAWVAAAGYLKTPEFDAWLHTLKPVFSSPLANLELRFSPDLARFLSFADRRDHLRALISGSSTRQEFDQSALLLGPGWSFPETATDGTSYRWAASEQVSVGLLAADGLTPTSLRLRVLPFPSPHEPPQTLAVALNQYSLSTVRIESGWRELAIPVPPGIWRRDANIVSFDLAWLRSPRHLDPESPDARSLGAAFDFVEVVTDGADSRSGAAD